MKGLEMIASKAREERDEEGWFPIALRNRSGKCDRCEIAGLQKDAGHLKTVR
jgi:hypothetical protein